MPLDIPVRQLDPELPLPGYARPDDAGLDLLARESARLDPGGGRARVPTGLVVAIPPGWAGFVQPRSGLAVRHGVTCLNSPGLIDAGFRGELAVLLVNHDPVEPFSVTRGDRIAQLVVQRVETVRLVLTDDLPDSERGEGGWGHSGVTDPAGAGP